jgi:hypothetical protein
MHIPWNQNLYNCLTYAPERMCLNLQVKAISIVRGAGVDDYHGHELPANPSGKGAFLHPIHLKLQVDVFREGIFCDQCDLIICNRGDLEKRTHGDQEEFIGEIYPNGLHIDMKTEEFSSWEKVLVPLIPAPYPLTIGLVALAVEKPPVLRRIQLMRIQYGMEEGFICNEKPINLITERIEQLSDLGNFHANKVKTGLLFKANFREIDLGGFDRTKNCFYLRRYCLDNQNWRDKSAQFLPYKSAIGIHYFLTGDIEMAMNALSSASHKLEQKIIFGSQSDEELRWPDEEIWQTKPKKELDQT